MQKSAKPHEGHPRKQPIFDCFGLQHPPQKVLNEREISEQPGLFTQAVSVGSKSCRQRLGAAVDRNSLDAESNSALTSGMNPPQVTAVPCQPTSTENLDQSGIAPKPH